MKRIRPYPGHRLLTALAACGVALLVFAAACGPGGPSEQSERLLLEAGQYRLNGELVRALENYTRAIADSPDYAAAHLARADTLSELGRRPEALRDYSRALALDESLATTIYVNRGVMHLGSRDYSRAIEDFERALSLEPDDPTTLSNRGLARARSGDLAGGLSDLDASISIASNNAFAFSTRALIRALAGRTEGSLQDYERAIQLRPGDSELLFQRALVLIEAGSLEQALEDLNQVVSISPEHARAYAMRAGVYRDLGQIAAAESDARMAESLGIDPDSLRSTDQRSLLPRP